MDIQTYLTSSGVTQTAFAQKVGVTQAMVWQWITRRRPVPVERCADIEIASQGAVTRKDLRPDDWHRIWPELSATEAGSASAA